MPKTPAVEFVEDDHEGYYVVAGATFRSLMAAARAVVEAWDLWSKIEVPADAFGVRINSLRAAIEETDRQSTAPR